ncbi:MAG: TAXI family TRAP transporter solute-binding subunit [Gammaproteobacteria bacterium]|nr:TAXI family TRAP transporter solute-binding subunit [Gammaproteobacteria bacterium]
MTNIITKFTRSKIRGSFSACLLFLLIGCDQVQTQSNTDGQTQVAQTALERSAQGERRKLTHLLLGTGSVRGVYFPIGGVICRLVNRNKAQHRIRCSLESTSGSIYNLRQLRDDNFDLVFAQSDWQFHAYHGSKEFENAGPDKALRAVFALESDPLSLLVLKQSEINQFDDLEGKTVSFGYTRSLQHRIMSDFLEAKKWSNNNFKEVRPMSDKRQIAQLCDGKLDSILLLTSSLEDNSKLVPQGCKLKFLPIQDASIKQLIADKPYYRTGVIKQGRYFDSENDIMSFGLGATFVAHESTSPKAIYNVVKDVVENFRDFTLLHPSLETLEKEDLPYAGISIPLHPGAERYYKEARLLK